MSEEKKTTENENKPSKENLSITFTHSTLNTSIKIAKTSVAISTLIWIIIFFTVGYFFDFGDLFSYLITP